MTYSHTQYSVLFRYIFVGILCLLGFILWQSGFDIYLGFFCVIILGIIYSFSSLTVSLDEKYLRVKFGYGIFKTKFLLGEIQSVKQVKNKWYYGWGIRVWFWPYMIIYNVDGFDAVEIRLKNKKIYRIGTDDGENLEREIGKKIP